MRRIATILLAIWGITIVYWQDTQQGGVYTNDTAYDAMFVISNIANTCRVISDEPNTPKVITADDFMSRLYRQNPEGINIKAAIIPWQ